jgi:hypothetical protein
MKTMTVAELKTALEDFNDEDRVVLVAPYGDRSKTLQALPVISVVNSQIKESAYSESGFAISMDSDDVVVGDVVAINQGDL